MRGNLTSQGHSRSKDTRGNKSSHMTSYLLVIEFMLLGSTVLKVQLLEIFNDLDLTFQGHPKSMVLKGNESSHITSDLLLIVTKWLGSTVLKVHVQAKM